MVGSEDIKIRDFAKMTVLIKKIGSSRPRIQFPTNGADADIKTEGGCFFFCVRKCPPSRIRRWLKRAKSYFSSAPPSSQFLIRIFWALFLTLFWPPVLTTLAPGPPFLSAPGPPLPDLSKPFSNCPFCHFFLTFFCSPHRRDHVMDDTMT